jgi:hypothetical protein
LIAASLEGPLSPARESGETRATEARHIVNHRPLTAAEFAFYLSAFIGVHRRFPSLSHKARHPRRLLPQDPSLTRLEKKEK